MFSSSVTSALQLLKRKLSSQQTQSSDPPQPSKKEKLSREASAPSPVMLRSENTNSNANTNSFAVLDNAASSPEVPHPEGDSTSSSSLSKKLRRREMREQRNQEKEEATAERAVAAATDAARPPSRLLLLVGLPGSGKSTLAEAIIAAGGASWARVSQDDLGSRQLCEQRVTELLEQRKNVVVDRCNHDPSQRAVWTQMARKARAAPVEVVQLDVPIDECVRRVVRRPAHPTLNSAGKSPQALAGVVYSFSKNFVRPAMAEGFGRLLVFNVTHSTAHIISQLQL